MTDKEIIIQEIERRIYFLDGMINTDFGRGSLDTLNKVLDFINSLSTEYQSEEFKGEFDDYLVHGDIRNPNFDGPFGYDDIKKTAIHFANWQKEQMMKGLCFETKVYQDCDGDDIESPFQTWLSLEQNEITALPNLGLSDGDKVKVIIVKEDEQ